MTWQETVNFLSLCLPRSVAKTIAALPAGEAREIRVRANRPVRIVAASGDKICSLVATQEQVNAIAESLSEHALYARADEQRHGYVTLRGGHRMGLCGRVIAQGGNIRALREISSLCVRIAGQWPGTADPVMPYLLDEAGRVRSMLVVGLPGTGKTTLLRDVCRQLSDGGLRMAMVDERSELAAMSRGVPQLDVGENTDVLDGAAKDVGLRWLLRGMGPHAMVTDEMGGMADAQAVLEAAQNGVGVITSVHGGDIETLAHRSALYHLMQHQVFSLYVLMDPNSTGKVMGVYDGQRQLILHTYGGNA
ncbi:MAG: AAA family ATPase [Clostridiales bacterium]|nr:AAA family ATPase [Clostridiales bacterium]